MAALPQTLIVLVLVLVVGGASLPNCTLRCKHKTCRESKARVSPVNDEVCRSLALKSRLSGPTTPSKLRLTEDPQRNVLIIKWKKKIISRSGNSSIYIPLPGRDSGICFNITIDSTRYKHKYLRFRCTDADTLDMTNKRFLLTDEDAEPVAVNEPMPDAQSVYDPDKTCDCWSVGDPHQVMLSCWSPDWVQLNPVKNRPMEVDVVWNPCNTSREIVVMIGPKGSHKTSDKATIPTYKLRDCLHSQKFTIKDPGEYEAWVGPLGCESPVYAKSAALQMPYRTDTVPENEVFQATTQPNKNPRPPSIQLVVILVGAFAFIGSLSLGVACFIMKLKRERLAPVTDPEAEPLTGKTTFEIVKGSEEKAVKEIAGILRRALPESNNDVFRIQDVTHRPHPGNRINMVVLLHDIHGQDDHSKLGNSNRTVTLQLDYTRSEMESPLVVHVPENMDHPSFTTRNNQPKQSSSLSLSDFLQLMETSLTSPEMTELEEQVKQLSTFRRDEIKNILLISGSDHRFHRNACRELAELLRMVGKAVIDPYDVHGKAIREIGPQEWTMKQMHKADLVLIVSSEKVYRLVERYEREEASGIAEGVDVCVQLCLKELSKGNFTGKTAFVTLGYGSGCLDRITEMYPRLSHDMRYCLVESKTGAFQEMRDQSHALRVFLCRMSSSLVDDACASSHCELFFENIEQMAAAMVEDLDCQRDSHNSMESFNDSF